MQNIESRINKSLVGLRTASKHKAGFVDSKWVRKYLRNTDRRKNGKDKIKYVRNMRYN